MYLLSKLTEDKEVSLSCSGSGTSGKARGELALWAVPASVASTQVCTVEITPHEPAIAGAPPVALPACQNENSSEW